MFLKSGKSSVITACVLAFICFSMLLGYTGRSCTDLVIPGNPGEIVNEEFGFRLKYPRTWRRADARDARRREDQARADTRDPEGFRYVDREVFSIAHVTDGQLAGRLSARYHTMSPAEYLERSLAHMDRDLQSLSYEVLGRDDDVVVAGRRFQKVKLHMFLDELVIHSEIYVTAANGGALQFGLTARSEAELDLVRGVLVGLRFDE